MDLSEHSELVESGLLPTSVFLAGFGLFGCTPGPMFNIAPFLGAAIYQLRGGIYGALGLFAPGVLLQLGLLPYWERVRRIKTVKTLLNGTNSAAVGLILTGVWMLMKKTMPGPLAYALVVSAGATSVVFKVSPAGVIFSHGVLGAVLAQIGVGGPYHVADKPVRMVLGL